MTLDAQALEAALEAFDLQALNSVNLGDSGNAWHPDLDLRECLRVALAAYQSAQPKPQETSALVEENERLRAIVDGRFNDAAALRLKHLHMEEGKPIDIAMQGEVVPLVAAYIAAEFKACGAENYLQMEMTHDELGPLVFTIQRRNGETPGMVARKNLERASTAEISVETIRKETVEACANWHEKQAARLRSKITGMTKTWASDRYELDAKYHEACASELRALSTSDKPGQESEHG